MKNHNFPQDVRGVLSSSFILDQQGQIDQAGGLHSQQVVGII